MAGNYRKPSGSGQLFGPANGVRFRHETSHLTNLFPIDSSTIGNIEDIKMLGLEASGIYGPFSAGGEWWKLGDVYRTKVPGGWLVMITNNARGLMFYPDPEHKWDGGSLTA